MKKFHLLLRKRRLLNPEILAKIKEDIHSPAKIISNMKKYILSKLSDEEIYRNRRIISLFL